MTIEKLETHILPETQEGDEQAMARLVCVGVDSKGEDCIRVWAITLERVGVMPSETRDVLEGAIKCEKCGSQNPLSVTRDAVRSPGRLFESDLNKNVAVDAREMYLEALLCFYGTSYRGAVAFCRSAVEESLAAKEVPGGVLDTKIKKAGKWLEPDEIALANAARIVGRNVIHHMAKVSQANAMGALTNSADLLNVIETKERWPAWQSKQGSNAP